MRKPITIAAHGNSCRITFPPATLRYLGWLQGTNLMLVVRDKAHVELVELETYYREIIDAQRAAAAAAQNQAAV